VRKPSGVRRAGIAAGEQGRAQRLPLGRRPGPSASPRPRSGLTRPDPTRTSPSHPGHPSHPVCRHARSGPPRPRRHVPAGHCSESRLQSFPAPGRRVPRWPSARSLPTTHRGAPSTPPRLSPRLPSACPWAAVMPTGPALSEAGRAGFPRPAHAPSHMAGPRALRTACGIRVGPLAAVPGPRAWPVGGGGRVDCWAWTALLRHSHRNLGGLSGGCGRASPPDLRPPQLNTLTHHLIFVYIFVCKI
jgi:hypothetical protein